MAEVARRCLECGIEARDLYDGKEESRDPVPARRRRIMVALETTAFVALGIIISTLATIGCITLWFASAFMWPWLPWA